VREVTYFFRKRVSYKRYFIVANTRFGTIMGLKRAKVIGRTFKEIFDTATLRVGGKKSRILV
jgi:hypothetical protein